MNNNNFPSLSALDVVIPNCLGMIHLRHNKCLLADTGNEKRFCNKVKVNK